ncbi:prepilin-type N-terminal cleavage/methylation domain-containing protein [Pirellulaceae bacterium SH449]
MRKDSLSNTKIRLLQRDSSPKRTGVTLLELMVALGLLAMLLLVAWSLFDNLQKAEERSAGLANRVQVLRQIRGWLAEDIDQFELPVFSLGETKASSNEAYFVGDATGFVATSMPSIDPLPFLQDAFASPSSVDSTGAMREIEREPENVSVYDTDQDRQVRAARRSPWPTDKINIEYRLLPDAGLSQRNANSQFEESRFRVVRRERMRTPVNSVPSSTSDSSAEPNGNGSALNSIPAADRLLTIRDLYRQDDTVLDTLGSVIREKSLAGLRNASFQYFDGSAWQDTWDSRQQNGFPLAVAIQFDFPSRAQLRKELVQRKQDSQFGDRDESASQESFGSIDSLLAQQSTARSESRDNQEYLIATSSNEVTIVVATHFRAPNPIGESMDNQTNGASGSMGNSSMRQRP